MANAFFFGVCPSAEPEPEEEEEEEYDGNYSIDEDGVEWFEDEDGYWWYREEGQTEWHGPYDEDCLENP